VVKYVRGLSHIARVKQQLITCTRPEEFIALMNQYEEEAAERAAARTENGLDKRRNNGFATSKRSTVAA
jgi:hypothetical protein